MENENGPRRGTRELTETENKVLKGGLEKISFDESGLVKLTSMDAALAWGQAMIDSGFAPDGFTRPAQVLFACQKGAELGLKPTASLTGFYPAPGGKLGVMVELALSILRGKHILREPTRDAFVYTGEGGKPDRTCTWTFGRRDWEPERWERSSFSLRQAAQAGLIKDNAKSAWRTHPDRLLKARAIGFAVKDFFSDVLYGVDVGSEPETENGDRPSTPPTPPPRARREPGPVRDPLLADVDVVDAEVVPEAEEPAQDSAVAFRELLEEARRRTGSDEIAAATLRSELQAAYQEGGIDAARTVLREHEVFGG